MTVAIKRLPIQSQKCFEAERSAFAHIKTHKLGTFNLAELLTDPLTTSKAHYFILPLAQGDMERSLQDPEFFSYKDATRAQMGPLTQGLAFLHETGLAHCDLKHKNILIYKCSNSNDLTLKIADFGHSFPISPDTHPKKDHFCKGTFSAPETWREEIDISLEPVDVWALGCMFMEIAAFLQTGSAGFDGIRKIRLGSSSAPQNAFHDTRALKPELRAWLDCLCDDAEYGKLGSYIRDMVRTEQRDRVTARRVFELM
jgi:serine/threonine protein kinase